MTGRNSIRIVLTPRDRQLLELLAEVKLLDREQIQLVCGFKSVTRANDRLFKLHAAGLLHRFRLGTQAGGRKALYCISAKGAAAAGIEKFWRLQRAEDDLLISGAFVEHQLALNWCWIAAKLGTDFKLRRFVRFDGGISPAISLMPDGYAELEVSGAIHSVLLEVDLGTESSRIWDKKVSLYIRLATSGEFQRIFHRPRFKVAVICTSARRLHNLRRVISKHTNKIFYFSLLETISHDGLLAPHWLRPDGDARESLA